MTNEELVKEIQFGNDVTKNLETLYLQNKRLIRKIVNKYYGQAEIDDLMQEAFFAIREAAYKFDCSLDCKFMSYAPYWIKQYCVRYIDNNSSVIRIPSYLQESIRKYEKYLSDTEMDGHKPSEEEIADHLGVTKEKLENIVSAATIQYISFDKVLKGNKDDDVGTLADIIADDSINLEEKFFDESKRKIIKNILLNCIAKLDEREAYIIKNRYYNNRTLTALAQELGISRKYVDDLEIRAIKKLSKMPELDEIIHVFGYRNRRKELMKLLQIQPQK